MDQNKIKVVTISYCHCCFYAFNYIIKTAIVTIVVCYLCDYCYILFCFPIFSIIISSKRSLTTKICNVVFSIMQIPKRLHMKSLCKYHVNGSLSIQSGLNQVAEILQTTFSNAFLWQKIFLFWFKFHQSLFIIKDQLTIGQHWFR